MISGLKNAESSGNARSKDWMMLNGIGGDCSMSRSYSARQCSTISVPCCERSSRGRDSSRRIVRDSFPYWIEAALCPSMSSLIFRNCITVVMMAVMMFMLPMTKGTRGLIPPGNVDWAKLAVPVTVLNTMMGRVYRMLDFLYMRNAWLFMYL